MVKCCDGGCCQGRQCPEKTDRQAYVPIVWMTVVVWFVLVVVCVLVLFD